MSYLAHTVSLLGVPQTPYSPWFDAPVILRISDPLDRTLHTELRCTITGETDSALHIQIGQQEQSVLKTQVLAVEETEDGRGAGAPSSAMSWIN
jgi:hypothetical protein